MSVHIYYTCGYCSLETLGPHKCPDCETYYCSPNCKDEDNLHKCAQIVTIQTIHKYVDRWFSALLESDRLASLVQAVPDKYGLYNIYNQLDQIMTCDELILASHKTLKEVLTSKLTGTISELDLVFSEHYIPLILNIYVDGRDFVVARRLPRIVVSGGLQ